MRDSSGPDASVQASTQEEASLHCSEPGSRQRLKSQHPHEPCATNNLPKTTQHRKDVPRAFGKETPGPVNYCHQQRHLLSTLRVHGREDRRTTRVLPARAARIRVVSIFTRSIATSKRQWNKTRTKKQPLTCSSRSLDDGTAAPRTPLSPHDVTGDG